MTKVHSGQGDIILKDNTADAEKIHNNKKSQGKMLGRGKQQLHVIRKK